jgi:hypothetical protein
MNKAHRADQSQTLVDRGVQLPEAFVTLLDQEMVPLMLGEPYVPPIWMVPPMTKRPALPPGGAETQLVTVEFRFRLDSAIAPPEAMLPEMLRDPSKQLPLTDTFDPPAVWTCCAADKAGWTAVE